MKNLMPIKLLTVAILYTSGIFGQYNSISFNKSNFSSFNINQIDYLENSTLIHFQYTNKDTLTYICVDENVYLQATYLDLSMFETEEDVLRKFVINDKLYIITSDEVAKFKQDHPDAMEEHAYSVNDVIYNIPDNLKNDFLNDFPNAKSLDKSIEMESNSNDLNKKYKLLNSYNLPFCNKVHFLESSDQFHNFTLEFEKLPNNILDFDVIDSSTGLFNLTDIKIDWTQVSQKLDLTNFINETPVKELGEFLNDGNKVMYYNHKGIKLAVELQMDNKYGKYFQAIILLQNLSGRDINFLPEQIVSYYKKGDELFDADVLTYEEYMKKIRNRQAWNSIAVTLSESMAAAAAGYSTSTTTASAYGYSNGNSSAYGSIGNTYVSAYGRSTTYSTAYGRSVTENYDGSKAYAASQNAASNIGDFQNQQFQIKRIISNSYAKANTLPNGSEYICYINIKYIEAAGLVLIIPVTGSDYYFWW